MPRPTTRRAASLIELVILISAAALIMALLTIVFARALGLRRSAQQQLEQTVQTARLATQFRRDVWAAERVEESPGPPQALTLELPVGHKVRYQIVDAALERTEITDGKAQVSRMFRIPATEVLRFEQHHRGDAEQVSLVVAPLRSPAVEGESPHGHPLHIKALLGRDLRHVRTAEASP